MIRRGWWQQCRLGEQIAAGVALAGLLALILTVALGSFLLHGAIISQQQTVLSRQATALSDCVAKVNLPRIAGKSTAGKLLSRVLDSTLAGTPQRGIIVTDGRGNLMYATSFPAAVLQSLLAQVRHDVAKVVNAGATTGRSFTMNGLLVSDVAASCAASGRVTAPQSAGILIAESTSVADDRWHDALVWIAVAGGAGLILILLAGIVLARVIAAPFQTVNSAAQAISTGNQAHVPAPAGPTEARTLATAFNAMLDEASRRERVDHDLLANISHELAASLGLIQGYAEGLTDGVIEGEKQRMASLRAITGESERLKRLTGQLLDLALLETGEAEVHLDDVPLPELLINLGARFTPVAEAQGVAVSIDVPMALPTVHTDGFRLEQVLVNLVTNALRHTKAEDVITMSARPAAGPSAGFAAAGVTIAVADTGAGIPAKELSHIWERFYQVDKARDRRRGGPGSGLGLAICHSAVTLLGGRIDVESVLGHGTTFRIWLPLMQSNA
ncbi:MAG: sensor histidine kinase [Chloroflexota bacterium]